VITRGNTVALPSKYSLCLRVLLDSIRNSLQGILIRRIDSSSLFSSEEYCMGYLANISSIGIGEA
jgi:hypothetical protein